VSGVFAVVLAFLIGAVPFSFLLARMQGVDIRRFGSGNVGATNLARALGLGRGLCGLLLDAAKGAAAVALARALGGGAAHPDADAVAGAAAVAGHVFSPFLRFRGGKGVATGAGAFAVLAPWPTLLALGVFSAALAIGRMVSLGSVLAAATLPLAAALGGCDRAVVLSALAVAALIVARHRGNLARIAQGAEHRIGRHSGAEGGR
jgi:glycerol-3-phosphate acyltransferase PlsY